MITKFLKKLICSVLLIYSLDLLLKGFELFVPINLITILGVTILGFPGLIMFALSFFFLI